MPDLKQSLRDFVATSNSGKYKTEQEVMSKFPELKGYDINVLRDFVATSNSGKYKTEDEVFSKFPEFKFSAPKKKVPTEVSKPSVGSSGTTKTPQKQSSDSSKPDGIYKFPTNPKANYKKEAGQWYVDPSGGTKFQPLTKGDVAKRVKVLESQAKREFNPYLETEEKFEFKAETKQAKPTEKVVGVDKKAQDVFKKEFQALDENDPIVIQKNTQDKKTNELISRATNVMKFEEEEAIPSLKKIFNEPGYNLFDFEETGAGDAVKVINKKTGESKVFAFDTDDKTEMDKLTAFINMNVKYKAIGDLTEESKKLQEQIDATYDPNKKLELSRKLKEVNNKLKIEESVRLSDATTDKNKAWSIYDKDAQQNAKAKIDSQLIRAIDYREKKKDLDKRQADLDAALKNNKITYEDYKTKYLPSILAEKEQLSVEEKEIKSTNSELAYESDRLNEVAGYNMLAQAERGDFLSGVSASFLKGVESPFRLIAGAAGVKTEKGFMMDELLAGLATDEYISDEKRSDIEKALFSVSESLGAAAGGAALTGGVGGVMSGPGATLGTYALSYYSLKDEIDSDPDMANVSEGEKMFLSGVYGGVIGLLDKFGLSKSLSKNPLGKKVVNGIMSKVFTSLPKNATAEMIEATVSSEVKSVIAKGIVNTAGGFVNEGATEGLQEFADVTIRDLYNKVKGKELLDKPKTWGEIFERAGESFWLGGLGGAAMSGATQAVEVPKQLRTVGQLKSIERIIDNPDMMDIFTDDLKVKVLNGEMSASKAKAAVNEMRESQAVFNMIPADVENKYAAFKLISEREFLSKEIEGKDPALVEDKKQRVNQIEEELRTLPKKQEVSVESKSVIPDEISSLNDDEQVIFNVETLEEVPEQFRDRAVKKKGMEVTLRRKILGLPIGKETKRILGDGYRYELTGKEAKDYAVQERSTEEVLPREQEQAGEAGSQREGMGQSIEGEEVTQEGVTEENPLSSVEATDLSNNRNKGLFPDKSEFADVIGESNSESNLSSYEEINGIGLAQYTNPSNGLVDVIMTGTTGSDYVGFVRVYENGKPTNRWTSKMENKSGNKGNFKSMISEVQKRLPEDHEYTEKTSISTDGIRVYSQQLERGYDFATDSNGDVITNRVAINGDSKSNILGIDVDSGNFDNIEVRTNKDFQAVKNAILPIVSKLGINESNIHWENGSVYIDLPVLSSKTTNKTNNETSVESKKNDIERRRKEDLDELKRKRKFDKKNTDPVNAKYDAELAALEAEQPTVENETQAVEETPTVASETQAPKERKIAFHGGNLSEGIKGVLYISEEEDQAKEYAEGNEGEVNKIDVTDLNIADEDTVYEIIKETGFQPKDGEYSVDELNLFELIDSRFETSLSDEDLSKLGEILADKGIDAVKFTDTNLKTLKQDVENIAVFNTSKVKLAEEAPIVEETTKENVAETEQVTEESEADQMIRLQDLLAKSNKTFVTKVINILKKTGLAKKVSMLNSKQIENKLKSFGINPDVAKQVAVWHGSPHSFDKFTTAAMGTGEGFQAFGWGLYFTDLKSIANTYAEKLSKNTYKYNGLTLDELEDNNMLVDPTTQLWIRRLERIKPVDREGAIEWFDNKKTGIAKSQHDEILNIINSIEIIPPSNRNLYKVSLHKGKQPSDYDWLVWDKKITRDQMKKILDNDIDGSITEALEDNFSELYDIKTTDELLDTMYNIGITGGDFYKILSKNIGDNPSGKDASLALLSAGIDGIKYPAESISRGATSDTARGFNYVVFDENAITIEEQIQFQKSLAAKGVQLITNGFVHKGEVYINSDNLNPETPIHEFSHLFNAWLKQNNKELYNKGIDLVKAELNNDNSEIKDVIDYVKSTQPNLSGDALYEEILTQLTGEKGAQLIKTNSAIGNWLKEFWKSIKDKLGLLDVTPEQLSKMTVSEFAEASAVQLLKGQKIGDAEVDVKFQKATEGMSAADIVRIGKASGISNTVIKKYLKDNGYTNYNSLFPSTKPSPAAKAAKAITKKPAPKMVTINEMEALKDQIRLEARAARGAKANIKENIKKISTLIKSMVTKGNSNIEQRHLKYIFNKLAATNLTNDASVDKLLDYIFKKMTDANYLNKLDEIVKINKAIKNNKSMVEPIASTAKEFAKINPALVGNIDTHLALAKKIKESLTRYTKETDPLGIEFRKNFDYNALYNYVENNKDKILKKAKKEISDIYEVMFGASSSNGMSDEKMSEKIKEAKENEIKKLKDFIQQKISSIKAIVENDPTVSDLVKRAANVDVDYLNLSDAIDIVNALTMYFDNGFETGLNKLVANYEGTKAVSDSNLKFAPIGVVKPGRSVARGYNDFFSYIEIMLEKKALKAGDVVKFLKESAFGLIQKGYNRSENETNELRKDYKNKFKKVKAFFNPENKAERALLSFVQRNVLDSKGKPGEFLRRKKLILESINQLRNAAGKVNLAIADLQEEAAKKLGILKPDGTVNESITIDEINNNAGKSNLEAVKWMQDVWSKKYSELYDHALGMHNTLIGRDEFYTPDRYSSIERAIPDDPNLIEFINFTGMTVNKSGVLIEARRPEALNNRFINMDFEDNNFGSYRAAMNDLYTAEARTKYKAYQASSKFDDIMGRDKYKQSKDAKLIRDAYLRYITAKENKGAKDSEIQRNVKKFLNKVSTLSGAAGLASVKNVFAQTFTTYFDTIFAAGPRSVATIFKDSFDPKVQAFIAKADSQVANRGMDAIKFTEKIQDEVMKRSKAAEAAGTVFDAPVWIAEQMLKYTNQKGDKLAAIGAWMTYYRKYCRKNGIAVDFNNVNEDAAQYAETKTKVQILPSDASERGTMGADNSLWASGVRQMLFPFSSFSINQKNRIYADIAKILRGEWSLKKESFQDLIGAITGLVTFHTINTAWKYFIVQGAISMLLDDEDEEALKKTLESALRLSATQGFTDLFSPIPLLDPFMVDGANLLIGEGEDNMFAPSEDKWLAKLDEINQAREDQGKPELDEDQEAKRREKFFKEEEWKLYVDEDITYLDKFGVYGIAAQKALELKDIAKSAATGIYEDTYEGKVTEKTLTKEGKEKMKALALLKSVGVVTGATDLSNIAQKAFYKVGKKYSLTDNQVKNTEEVKEWAKEYDHKFDKYAEQVIKIKRSAKEVKRAIMHMEDLSPKEKEEYIKTLKTD